MTNQSVQGAELTPMTPMMCPFMMSKQMRPTIKLLAAVLSAMLLVPLLFVGCVNVEDSPETKLLSKVDIIEIANKAAAHMGYDLQKMKVSIDDKNTIWSEYLSSGPASSDMFIAKTIDHLKGRNYWAVYYEPKPQRFGGDLFVFVDRQTGEIITTLAFQ